MKVVLSTERKGKKQTLTTPTLNGLIFPFPLNNCTFFVLLTFAIYEPWCWCVSEWNMHANVSNYLNQLYRLRNLNEFGMNKMKKAWKGNLCSSSEDSVQLVSNMVPFKFSLNLRRTPFYSRLTEEKNSLSKYETHHILPLLLFYVQFVINKQRDKEIPFFNWLNSHLERERVSKKFTLFL